jgi:hypothetical protein
MKFGITLNETERKSIFGEDSIPRDFELSINGTKFKCRYDTFAVNTNSSRWGIVKSFEFSISAFGEDKKAQEIAQAKAEVNRTKEAHKEAQRKLSALMEEENVK